MPGMELRRRTWTKALTWQMVGLAVMTAVNYWYLGDWRQGAALSMLLTVQGLITYVIHERIWARVPWGRLPAPTAPEAPSST